MFQQASHSIKMCIIWLTPLGTSFSLHGYFHFQTILKYRVSLWLKPNFRYNFSFSLLLVPKWTVILHKFHFLIFIQVIWQHSDLHRRFFFPAGCLLFTYPTNLIYSKVLCFWAYDFRELYLHVLTSELLRWHLWVPENQPSLEHWSMSTFWRFMSTFMTPLKKQRKGKRTN